MVTQHQSALVSLVPGEALLCYDRGHLKEPNPKWDNKVPTSDWGKFWQGFRGRAKYIHHTEIDLMFGLTNQRLFVEPKDWGLVINTMIHIFVNLAPVHPGIQHKAEAGLEEQEQLVKQARDSGEPLISIAREQIRRATIDPDEFTYMVEYTTEGEESTLYFVVYDNYEGWAPLFQGACL